MIGLAVIGAGRWGKNLIRAAQSLTNARLVAVGSANPDTRSFVPKDCEVASWQSTILNPRVDAVIVASPPSTHREIAEAAIFSGKHVLIEKPLALLPEDADSILDAAERGNVVVSVEFTQLHNPRFQSLCSNLPIIGRLRGIRTEAGNSEPIRKDVSVLHDWAPHELSMLQVLCGELPTEIIGKKIAEQPNELGETCVWEIRCKFKDQITAISEFGNLMTKRRRVAAFGENGVLLFDDVGRVALSLHEPCNSLEFPCGPGKALFITDSRSPLEVALSEFVSDISTGKRRFSSLVAGAEFVRILDGLSPNKIV